VSDGERRCKHTHPPTYTHTHWLSPLLLLLVHTCTLLAYLLASQHAALVAAVCVRVCVGGCTYTSLRGQIDRHEGIQICPCALLVVAPPSSSKPPCTHAHTHTRTPTSYIHIIDREARSLRGFAGLSVLLLLLVVVVEEGRERS
jgi:hypothetical protein